MLTFLIEQKNQYFSKNKRKTLTLRPSCGSHQDMSVAQTECPLSLTPGQWVFLTHPHTVLYLHLYLCLCLCFCHLCEQHGVLVVDIVVSHSMVQHPRLVS